MWSEDPHVKICLYLNHLLRKPFFPQWVVWSPCQKSFDLKCGFSIWFHWSGCLSVLKSVTCWFDLLWFCTLWNLEVLGCSFNIMLNILHFLQCCINFSVSFQFYWNGWVLMVLHWVSVSWRCTIALAVFSLIWGQKISKELFFSVCFIFNPLCHSSFSWLCVLCSTEIRSIYLLLFWSIRI